MPECTKVLSDIDYEQQTVDTYNRTDGTNQDKSKLFDIYDCKVCRNKFKTAFLNSEHEFTLKICECMNIRKSLFNIDKSGLTEELKSKTFETYEVTSDWQNTCKSIALKYVSQYSSGAWLFAGGQSGSGKTHLCTAVCNELLKKGVAVRYILWREIIQKLSSNRFSDDYQNILNDISKADVIYIDDFLKSFEPKKELNWAFEIINARYTQKKPTIISSEMQINDIDTLDSAVAGRISERSKGFKIQINKNSDRNYRLKGDEFI